MTVAMCDFWAGAERFRQLLSPFVTPDDHLVGAEGVRSADLTVFSVFGERHLLACGTKLSVSAEARVAPAGSAHWYVDGRYRPEDNHLRLPPWYSAATHQPAASVLALLLAPEPEHRRFCNFIYSNPRCVMRNAFFEALNAREHVDALGEAYRNASHPLLSIRGNDKWQTSKRVVLSDYRFTVAFENEEAVGYTTEKMIDAWLADSVPIYWGNPTADTEFPEGSYLSLYEAGTMRRLVDQVLEAHHNPERYAQLRAANPFRTGALAKPVEQFREELRVFGRRVHDDAVAHRGRPRKTVLAQTAAAARFAQYDLRRRIGQKIH